MHPFPAVRERQVGVRPRRSARSRRLSLRYALTAAVAAVVLIGSPQAQAYSGQQSIMDDDFAFGGFPAGGPVPNDAVNDALALGVNRMRIFIYWNRVAPNPNSCTPPPAEDQLNPDRYAFVAKGVQREFDLARGPDPAHPWFKIDVVLGGSFPCWASNSPDLCPPPTQQACNLRPNITRYRRFVNVVGQKYGFAVSRWSPWNEPNTSLRTGGADTPADRGLLYRNMWFSAKSELAQFSSAPFWFGETTSDINDAPGDPPNGNHRPSRVIPFLDAAFCTANQQSSDATYPSCTTSPQIVNAEAISFHPYGHGSGADDVNPADDPVPFLGDPEEHRRQLVRYQSYRASVADLNPPRISQPSYIAETEFGFNTAGGFMSERVQAAYMNCAEESAWKTGSNLTTAQFELQDSGGVNTGLRRAASGMLGVPKESYAAYRLPFTVYRLPDGRLEVWGVYRPANVPKPATVAIEALRSDFSVAFSTSVQTDSSGSFHAFLSGAPAGFSWWARVGVVASRVANGTDCGANWQGFG
jgi:hypothetical protein